MNNKNIEEIRKEYIENFTDEGSYKVQGDYDTVWEWIETKLTNLLQAEKEQYLDEFLAFGFEKYGEWIEINDSRAKTLLEQFKKESV